MYILDIDCDGKSENEELVQVLPLVIYNDPLNTVPVLPLKWKLAVTKVLTAIGVLPVTA